MEMSKERRQLRARIAGTLSGYGPDADVTDLRTQLKALKAEEYIRQLVDTFPPLTNDQRARLAALLRPARETEAA